MSNIPCVVDDSQFNRYLFEYRHDGAEYGIEIYARSPTEAKERINALNFARYCGEVKASIRVPDVGGFFGRSLPTLRKSLTRFFESRKY